MDDNNPKQNLSQVLASILKLTRFGNLIIIGFAQYLTAACLIGFETIQDLNLFLLAASTVLIAAAGYIINDYYDIKIDFINKPERVIISKTIPRRYAILLHILLSTLGFLFGLYLSWKIALINLISIFLLWFYSNYLKRIAFIGNFTVALLTSMSILIIDMFYNTDSSLVIIYACFAFFMTLIREIIKDMEDLKGDNIFGCKTLPIVLGIRQTKTIIYAILALFSIIVLVLNYFYKALPLFYYLIFLFVPLLALLYFLVRSDMKKDFTFLSTFCKLIMILGILSMIFV